MRIFVDILQISRKKGIQILLESSIVLLRFAVSNFQSIYERQEISFVASKLKDCSDGLINHSAVPGIDILPVCLVYGANASGKSNVINSLRYMKAHVLYSHSKGSPEGGVPRSKFALADEDSSDNKELSSMEIDFVVDGVRYHYGYEYDDQSFQSEWLYSYPEGVKRTLFERVSPTSVVPGKTLRGEKKTLETLMRHNSLYVSVAAQNNHEQLSSVYKFFRDIKFNAAISVDQNMVSRSFQKSDIDNRAIKFLGMIGTGVTGVRKTKLEVEPDGEIASFRKEFSNILQKYVGSVNYEKAINEDRFSVELSHSAKSGKEVYFKIEDESAGTRRLLVVLSSVFKALDAGDTVVIDEIDASLHTKASEAIVKLFLNKKTNPKGAQLLATTHDTNMLIAKCMRRDEVWFVEKDDFGATELFPLTDIATRKTDDIEKGYLQSRFGAVPPELNVEDVLCDEGDLDG
ncbi:AAA family ATPase [Thalassospira lucentensis]|uniref:AAA family ATPase n=1 Tax=Thalassospira lucentensis TaxID=168935 RepID=UPI003D2EB83A